MDETDLAVKLTVRLVRRVREKLTPQARAELEEALEQVNEEAQVVSDAEDIMEQARRRKRDPDKDRPADQDGRAPVVDLAKDDERRAREAVDLATLAAKAGILPGERFTPTTLEELARKAGVYR